MMGQRTILTFCLRDVTIIPKLRPITLGKTSGQSAAMIVGTSSRRGNWIATLDADLQNDPADLVQLWMRSPATMERLVVNNEEGHISKRVTSACANWSRNDWHQASPFVRPACRVALCKKALRLPVFQGCTIWSTSLRDGCNLIQIPVAHRSRVNGRSTITFGNCLLNVLVDLIGVVWLMTACALSSHPQAKATHYYLHLSIKAIGCSDARNALGGLSCVKLGLLARGGLSGSSTIHRTLSGAVVGL